MKKIKNENGVSAIGMLLMMVAVIMLFLLIGSAVGLLNDGNNSNENINEADSNIVANEM